MTEATNPLKLYPSWKQALAEWETQGIEPGQTIEKEWLEERFGITPAQTIAQAEKNNQLFRTSIWQLRETLLTKHKLILRPVAGVGYRVVEPSEQEGLARGRQRRARRQIAKGVSLVVNVDRNALTIEQRASVDALCQVLTAQNAMLRRHDRRIGTVERTVQEVDSRVTVMEALLRRHGIDLPQGQTVEGEIVPEI